LWVSWVRRNLIGQQCFWDLDCSNSGSWIWKSICKLRSLARPFIVCEVNSGITCNFWSDNWTSLGPLIDITGDMGPRVSGLSRIAVVADAIINGEWWLSRSRSRNNIIQLLKACLPPSSVVIVHEEDVNDDTYLWKVGESEASSVFTSAKVWDFLNPPGTTVDWFDAVWFKGNIPKHAFICWLATRHRLHTRDRLLNWGLVVPSVCLLCNTHDESRQHLLFDCAFADEVWSFFTSKARVSPPNMFEDAVIWLKSSSRDENIALILKLAFHASIYLIWKERNSRLHGGSPRLPVALILEAKSLIRCRLDPLSRKQRILPHGLSYLASWFGVFQT
ncbi:uncharacterized protein LOC110224447, partial [Arabidopsis lyrata subsp. lyrata]|uniref:uncharacterized protein LOC110224447 n=1 Tax=Arabidopsis lyrata subsp. lyrata TaxID=81972 RepID=UPI000A29A6D4